VSTVDPFTGSKDGLNVKLFNAMSGRDRECYGSLQTLKEWRLGVGATAALYGQTCTIIDKTERVS